MKVFPAPMWQLFSPLFNPPRTAFDLPFQGFHPAHERDPALFRILREFRKPRRVESGRPDASIASRWNRAACPLRRIARRFHGRTCCEKRVTASSNASRRSCFVICPFVSRISRFLQAVYVQLFRLSPIRLALSGGTKRRRLKSDRLRHGVSTYFVDSRSLDSIASRSVFRSSSISVLRLPRLVFRDNTWSSLDSASGRRREMLNL